MNSLFAIYCYNIYNSKTSTAQPDSGVKSVKSEDSPASCDTSTGGEVTALQCLTQKWQENSEMDWAG